MKKNVKKRKITRKGKLKIISRLVIITSFFVGTIFFIRKFTLIEDDIPVMNNTTQWESQIDDEKSDNLDTFELSLRDILLKANFDSEVENPFVSESILLINRTSKEIIYHYKVDELRFPASLVKMMTVLIGINYAYNDIMTVRADFESLAIADAMIVGFNYGEVRPAREILHAALLSSGADATATIANHVSGSYENFIDLMNEYAQKIGMYDTFFTNSSGLHHDDQVTTARDMAIFLDYAIDNPIFYEIFTTPSYEIEWNSNYSQTLTLLSTMFMFLPFPESTNINENSRIIGGRTGFTSHAGRNLASLATSSDSSGTNEEIEFILINLGARSLDEEENRTIHIKDAIAIYERFLQ